MDHNIQPRLVFRIEQVALCVADPARAIALLTKMGAGEWARDHVKASGKVRHAGGTNEADLAFDYEMLKDARELEVLNYTDGPNWMEGHPNVVSHFGMHCDEKELLRWRKFMEDEGFHEIQAVRTFAHTNPAIRTTRRYNYVIFNTREVLGVDIKFIVRLPV